MNPYSKKYRHKHNKKKTLKRVLRKNKTKKQRGGIGFFDFLKNRNYTVTATPEQIKQNQDLDKNVQKEQIQAIQARNNDQYAFENNAKTLKTISTIGMAITGINIVTPFFAMSGVGLPLVGVLLLCKQMAELFQQNVQLSAMFQDLLLILDNCFNLYDLITYTDSKFKEAIDSNKTENKFVINEKSLLEQRLIDKLNLLNKLIIKIAPGEAEKYFQVLSEHSLITENNNNIQTQSKLNEQKNLLTQDGGGVKEFVSSGYQNVKSGLNKAGQQMSNLYKKLDVFFYSEYHKNYIVKELTLINSLFMFMNSQFEWRVKSYEYKLGQGKSKEIWESIITDKSDESKYQKYMSKDFVNKVSLENMVITEGKTGVLLDNAEQRMSEIVQDNTTGKEITGEAIHNPNETSGQDTNA